MAQRVGMGAKKKASEKENTEVKNLKAKIAVLEKAEAEKEAKIAELEKENVETIKNVETLQKENEALKAEVAKLKK